MSNCSGVACVMSLSILSYPNSEYAYDNAYACSNMFRSYTHLSEPITSSATPTHA